MHLFNNIIDYLEHFIRHMQKTKCPNSTCNLDIFVSSQQQSNLLFCKLAPRPHPLHVGVTCMCSCFHWQFWFLIYSRESVNIICDGMITNLGSWALTCLWHKLWYRSTLRKPWFRTRWQIMSMRLHTWREQNVKYIHCKLNECDYIWTNLGYHFPENL